VQGAVFRAAALQGGSSLTSANVNACGLRRLGELGQSAETPSAAATSALSVDGSQWLTRLTASEDIPRRQTA